MAQRSHVSSVEAIEAFRASLIVYLSKARPAIEEISNEVSRLEQWLEHDQHNHWVAEIRMRTRKLEEAQQELFTAKMSKMKDATAAQEMALQRARQQLREAEEKQVVTRRWSRDLENRTQPLLKEISQLHTFVTTDLVRAVEYLVQVLRALDAYAGIPVPGGGSDATSTADPAEAAGDAKAPDAGEKGGTS